MDYLLGGLKILNNLAGISNEVGSSDTSNSSHGNQATVGANFYGTGLSMSTSEQIVQAYAKKYGVSESEAKQDLFTLANQFSNQNAFKESAYSGNEYARGMTNEVRKAENAQLQETWALEQSQRFKEASQTQHAQSSMIKLNGHDLSTGRLNREGVLELLKIVANTAPELVNRTNQLNNVTSTGSDEFQSKVNPDLNPSGKPKVTRQDIDNIYKDSTSQVRPKGSSNQIQAPVVAKNGVGGNDLKIGMENQIKQFNQEHQQLDGKIKEEIEKANQDFDNDKNKNSAEKTRKNYLYGEKFKSF